MRSLLLELLLGVRSHVAPVLLIIVLNCIQYILGQILWGKLVVAGSDVAARFILVCLIRLDSILKSFVRKIVIDNVFWWVDLLVGWVREVEQRIKRIFVLFFVFLFFAVVRSLALWRMLSLAMVLRRGRHRGLCYNFASCVSEQISFSVLIVWGLSLVRVWGLACWMLLQLRTSTLVWLIDGSFVEAQMILCLVVASDCHHYAWVAQGFLDQLWVGHLLPIPLPFVLYRRLLLRMNRWLVLQLLVFFELFLCVGLGWGISLYGGLLFLGWPLLLVGRFFAGELSQIGNRDVFVLLALHCPRGLALAAIDHNFLSELFALVIRIVIVDQVFSWPRDTLLFIVLS